MKLFPSSSKFNIFLYMHFFQGTSRLSAHYTHTPPAKIPYTIFSLNSCTFSHIAPETGFNQYALTFCGFFPRQDITSTYTHIVRSSSRLDVTSTFGALAETPHRMAVLSIHTMSIRSCQSFAAPYTHVLYARSPFVKFNLFLCTSYQSSSTPDGFSLKFTSCKVLLRDGCTLHLCNSCLSHP